VLAHLTRLFRSPSAVLTYYSDEQTNKRLCYIAFAATVISSSIVDATLPVTDRVACVTAMARLYDELFAPRCSPTLAAGQGDTSGSNPLSSACYMWWDILPLRPGMPHPAGPSPAGAGRDSEALDIAAMATMRHALELPSIACQESALHGLGHWACGYPAEVQAAVDAFLDNSNLHPRLRQYAGDARAGEVL